MPVPELQSAVCCIQRLKRKKEKQKYHSQQPSLSRCRSLWDESGVQGGTGRQRLNDRNELETTRKVPISRAAPRRVQRPRSTERIPAWHTDRLAPVQGACAEGGSRRSNGGENVPVAPADFTPVGPPWLLLGLFRSRYYRICACGPCVRPGRSRHTRMIIIAIVFFFFWSFSHPAIISVNLAAVPPDRTPGWIKTQAGTAR